jgi:hypothetical protein
MEGNIKKHKTGMFGMPQQVMESCYKWAQEEGDETRCKQSAEYN